VVPDVLFALVKLWFELVLILAAGVDLCLLGCEFLAMRDRRRLRARG
jgi:hypothetical protein